MRFKICNLSNKYFPSCAKARKLSCEGQTLSLCSKFFLNTSHHRTGIAATVHGILEFLKVRFHPLLLLNIADKNLFSATPSIQMCQFPILHSTLTGPVDKFSLKRLFVCNLTSTLQSSDALLGYSFKFLIKYDIKKTFFKWESCHNHL